MRAHQRCAEQAAPSNDDLAHGAWHWAFEQAKAHWNWGPLSFREFCEHLSKLGHSTSLPAEITSLYLCLGCSVGILDACRALEDTYFPGLRLLLRNKYREQVTEDVMQDVRERLLVGPCPKIATYRGNGPLAGWLRAVALNLARDRTRSEHSQRLRLLQARALDATLCEGNRPRSPEDLFTEAQLGAACRHALATILHSISTRDRQLLHHAFVSNLSIDEIGAMYEVDRSTAARWLKRTVETTRAQLSRALGDLLGYRRHKDLPTLLRATCPQHDSSFVHALEALVGEWLTAAPPSSS